MKCYKLLSLILNTMFDPKMNIKLMISQLLINEYIKR